MSIKIYHGYRLPSMPAYKLAEFFETFRKRADAERKRRLSEVIFDELVRIYDSHTLGILTSSDYFFKDIDRPGKNSLAMLMMDYGFAQQKRRTAKDSNNPDFDFDLTIMVYPMRGQTLCIVFSNYEFYETMFANTRNVSFYGYWNNSDKPDGTTNKDWKRRGRDWDRAISGFSYNASGFIFELVSVSGIECSEEIKVLAAKKAISFEKRIERASKFFAHQLYAAHAGGMPAEASGWNTYIDGFNAWYQSDEGQTSLESIRPRIIEGLNPDVGIHSFWEEIDVPNLPKDIEDKEVQNVINYVIGK